MAKRRNGHHTKQEYVDVTCRIIEEEGLETLSIRKIAQQVGCDSAVLYRHFENLDYLLMVGCIRFLEDYIQDLAAIERIQESAIDKAIDSWHVFSHYAFKNPQLFYRVFYDCDTQLFEDAIVEYFQLFPIDPKDRTETFYGFFFLSLFSGNPHERNLYYFNRAANEGALAQEDVEYLCNACPYVFSGTLRDFSKGVFGDLDGDAAAARCNYLVDRVIESCRIDEHEPRIEGSL
jgi:AcrR family transcriptional regulator